jgi:hypothetical protein
MLVMYYGLSVHVLTVQQLEDNLELLSIPPSTLQQCQLQVWGLLCSTISISVDSAIRYISPNYVNKC